MEFDDLISRAATIDAVENLASSMSVCINVDEYNGMRDMKYRALKAIKECPSAQPDLDSAYTEGYTQAEAKYRALWDEMPEIIRCKDCTYYDPPHVENNGVRYEYDEMPADAFDALGTGLVNAEYGINIGGRCCVDYYCNNYSDDKRVFVREDNYCGRAKRRTDGSD